MLRTCPQCGRKYTEGEAFCPYDGARLRDAAPAAAAPTPEDPLVGKTLDGRYALDRVLGRGGMGTVYSGRLVALEKPVAIKVLRDVEDDDDQAMGRFEREARTAGSLGEEHIVDIFDFGRSGDGLAYLVMELLDGRDLGDLLARYRMLPIERAVPIIMQCCQALGAAHAAGIVHRDLKPENIFLIERGQNRDFVKIVDFGLAKITETETTGEPGRKLTKTGMIFGTPQYMSPEQCTGKPTDHRADIYALGIIMYEMLAGRVPFDGENFMGILNQHLMDPPPPIREIAGANVPPALEMVVYRCLDKKAGQRPASMRDVADEILAALRESGLDALADQVQSLGKVGDPTAFMKLTKKKSTPPPPRRPVSVSPPARVDVHSQTAPAPDPRHHRRTPEAFARTAYSQPAMQPSVRPPSRPRSQPPPAAKPPPGQRTPTPRAPRVSVENTTGGHAQAGKRPAVFWILGGLVLLAVGGALGYGVLLALR